MKNANYTIGNRIRDLLACSEVPEPTALPRTSHQCVINGKTLNHTTDFKLHSRKHRSSHSMTQIQHTVLETLHTDFLAMVVHKKYQQHLQDLFPLPRTYSK
jgi:putative AlgH/UPF0301 family transcriptional regulator